MLPFNHDPLRVRLATDFAILTSGVKDAATVSHAFALISQTTLATLGALVMAWSQSNEPIMKLPEEALALCFTFLPFADRITASHVSRRWRAVALAYPAIWADMEIPYQKFRNQNRVLHMAISRTGRHPVDLRGLSAPDPEGILAVCLSEHMDHLRTIDFNVPGGSFPLLCRAPMLETLAGIHDRLDIPNNFLGGQPARLRTLSLSSVSLPAICPALSTVTSLTLDIPEVPVLAETFRALFILCPNVEALHLGDQRRASADALPRGPAPASLTTLELLTNDDDFDLTPLYVDWRTDTLRMVSLEQLSPSVSRLDQLVVHARTLTIGKEYGFDRTYITAQDAARRTRSIMFDEEGNDAAHAAELLLAVQAKLEDVRAAVVPDSALGSLLPVLAALPKLRRVGLSIEPSLLDLVNGKDSHKFKWDARCLCRIADRCPNLRAIDLEVSCLDECPLTAADARYLLSCIASLGDCTLPEVCIKGFPRHLVSDVEVPELDRLRVMFSGLEM